MKNSILIVEDDKAIRNFIAATLSANSYCCDTANTAEQGILFATTKNPDVILLDLGLPDMDGIDLIKKIRTWSICPIIVVSARSEDKEKVEALDAGADDYLTKPFSMVELLARIRVALRKTNYEVSKNNPIFKNGELKIDYAAGCIFVNNSEVHLTPIEYKIICLFSKNVGKVLTHKYILKEVWGTYLESDIPSLRVFMATLRKKLDYPSLEEPYIQTHIGVGYRMIRLYEDGENI